MNARIVMKVLSVYYAVALGLVWLISPGSGLNHDPSPYATFVARDVGTFLIAIAIMNWIISTQSPAAIRWALGVNIALNAAPMVATTINLSDGTFGSSNWVGIAAHALPLLAALYCLAFGRPESPVAARSGLAAPATS